MYKEKQNEIESMDNNSDNDNDNKMKSIAHENVYVWIMNNWHFNFCKCIFKYK